MNEGRKEEEEAEEGAQERKEGMIPMRQRSKKERKKGMKDWKHKWERSKVRRKESEEKK